MMLVVAGIGIGSWGCGTGVEFLRFGSVLW